MRRLWLLSLVFLAAVCAAAAEEKAPIECYYSFGDYLGPTKKCKDHCTLLADEDGRIHSRNCDIATTHYCSDTLPLTYYTKTDVCRCNGTLCNNLVPPDFKCFSGAEGDCDYLSATNVFRGSDGTDYPFHFMPERSASIPLEVRSSSFDTKSDTTGGYCFKTTYSFQSKSCTVYGFKAEASQGAEWTLTTSKDGNTRTGNRTLTAYDDSPSATFVEVKCIGSLCNIPKERVIKADGTGLTLSLVGLMAAAVAAYST